MLKLKERLPSKGGVPKKGETYPGVKLKMPKGTRHVMDMLWKTIYGQNTPKGNMPSV